VLSKIEDKRPNKMLLTAQALVRIYSTPNSVVDTLKKITEIVSKVLDARLVSIMLLDEDEELLHIKAHFQGTEGYVKKPPLRVSKSLIGDVVKHKVPIFTQNIQQDDRFVYKTLMKDENLSCLLSVPSISNGRVIGVLNTYWGYVKVLDEEELELANLCALHSAMAIENTNLHEEVVNIQKEIARKERLISLGELSAGLAHEIRNPLNVINMLIYAIKDQFSEFCYVCPIAEDMAIVQKEVQRINLLIEQFIDFARPGQMNLSLQNIKEILEEVLLITTPEAKYKNIFFVKNYQNDPIYLNVDGDKIKQVFLNIILNAIQSMDSGGDITISFCKKKGFYVMIFLDQGCGLKDEDVSKIFVPFYSTKKKGLGLGLPLSARIIDAHGGKLSIEPRLNQKGACASILLPTQ